MNLFKFRIIGPDSTYREDFKVSLNTGQVDIKYKDIHYRGYKNQAFKKDRGFFDRLFSGIKTDYYMIFTEKNPASKDKQEPIQVQPPDITINIEQDKQQYLISTSSLLYKVYKYNGAKKAYDDEFKEQRDFNVPIWAIMIVVLVLVALAVFGAEYMGLINFLPQIGPKVIK